MALTLIEQKPGFNKKVEGEDKLAIAEMFSDTLQGEGPNTGIVSTFVRLQGCTLKCAWCFPERVRVLMSDFSYKRISEIRSGDRVKTYSRQGLVDTKVLSAAPTRQSKLVRVWLENGHHIDSTPDHKFMAYDNPTSKDRIRLRETKAKDLVGFHLKQMPDFSKTERADSAEYALGYLKGVVEGDCNVQQPYRIKLECVDIEMIEAFRLHLKTLFDYEPTHKLVVNKKPNQSDYYRLVVSKKSVVAQLTQAVRPAEMRGYIAGFFDAEGHVHKSSVSVTQKTATVLESIQSHIHTNLDIESSIKHKPSWDGYELNFSGQANVVKFLTHYQPAIDRKRSVAHMPSQYKQTQKVVRVEQLDNVETVYSLSTEKGTYIADHVWVRNCDTLDVWSVGNEYSFDEIFEMWEKVGLIDRFKDDQHLILTGGSPIKQQDRLLRFLDAFEDRYSFLPYIEVENEAVLMPSEDLIKRVDWWNNSPKLANSGMKERVRIKPEVLNRLKMLHNVCYKFVIQSQEEWDEIERDFIKPGYIWKEDIILMPEGQSQEQLAKTRALTADLAIKHGVRFSDRLHITLWDKATAV